MTDALKTAVLDAHVRKFGPPTVRPGEPEGLTVVSDLPTGFQVATSVQTIGRWARTVVRLRMNRDTLWSRERRSKDEATVDDRAWLIACLDRAAELSAKPGAARHLHEKISDVVAGHEVARRNAMVELKSGVRTILGAFARSGAKLAERTAPGEHQFSVPCGAWCKAFVVIASKDRELRVVVARRGEKAQVRKAQYHVRSAAVESEDLPWLEAQLKELLAAPVVKENVSNPQILVDKILAATDYEGNVEGGVIATSEAIAAQYVPSECSSADVVVAFNVFLYYDDEQYDEETGERLDVPDEVMYRVGVPFVDDIPMGVYVIKDDERRKMKKDSHAMPLSETIARILEIVKSIKSIGALY